MPADMRHDATGEQVKRLADEIEKLAFAMPPPNIYTPQFVMLAQTLRSTASETPMPKYTVEQLESWQQSFENLRREFHRQGNHDGQSGCEFALEAIRLYQSTPSATRRVEPDNVGDTDRWQDPRDLSGGATDAPDDKHARLVKRLRDLCVLCPYENAPGLIDAAIEAADALEETPSATRANELEKANVGLATEAAEMRMALSELVASGDALGLRDDMKADDEERAQKRWDEAQEKARPFTEDAIMAKAERELYVHEGKIP